jgi:hypothetical protein
VSDCRVCFCVCVCVSGAFDSRALTRGRSGLRVACVRRRCMCARLYAYPCTHTHTHTHTHTQRNGGMAHPASFSFISTLIPDAKTFPLPNSHWLRVEIHFDINTHKHNHKHAGKWRGKLHGDSCTDSRKDAESQKASYSLRRRSAVCRAAAPPRAPEFVGGR